MMRSLVLACLAAASLPLAAEPLGTAFTYQGRLNDNGQPATGLYDFEFCLFDALAAGTVIACSSQASTADVPVENGVFTARIDAGTTPFVGEKRFLEIRVRPGASAGAFEVLAPRQLITAVPEALRAASVANGQVGAQQINLSEVQARVAGTCQSDQYMQSVASNGTVSCSGVNFNQVQARVTGNCIAGAYITSINGNGTVQCGAPPPPSSSVPSLMTIANSSKKEISMAKGPDGVPVIAARDDGTNNLQVIRCTSAECTTVASAFSVDIGNISFPAVAIRSDNRPVVSYFDETNDRLKLAICATQSCASSTVIELDATIQVGSGTSLVLTPDNLPIVAYHAATGEIRVARCFNEDCSGAINRTTVATVGLNGNPSIALAADGLPMVTYNDVNQGDLRFAKCTTVLCQAPGGVSLQVIDTAAVGSGASSLARGLDGHPVISYSAAPGNLKFVRCVAPDCFGSGAAQVIDNTGAGLTTPTSMSIAANGTPVISYADTDDGFVKVAKCFDPSCSGGKAVTILDSGTAGEFNDVLVTNDGLPVVAYSKPNSLVVAKCRTSSCQ